MTSRITFILAITILSSCSTAKEVSTTNDYEDSRDLLEYNFEFYLIAPNYRSLIYLTNEKTVMTYNAPEEKLPQFFSQNFKRNVNGRWKSKKQ